MEKKISKNQKMYPHRFGCSQNHPKAPKNPIFGLRYVRGSFALKSTIGVAMGLKWVWIY